MSHTDGKLSRILVMMLLIQHCLTLQGEIRSVNITVKRNCTRCFIVLPHAYGVSRNISIRKISLQTVEHLQEE